MEHEKATQKEMNEAHWQYVNGVLALDSSRVWKKGVQKPFWSVLLYVVTV